MAAIEGRRALSAAGWRRGIEFWQQLVRPCSSGPRVRAAERRARGRPARHPQSQYPADYARPARLAAACHRPQGYCRRARSEEHTSELQSLMRISYAVFCLKKKYTHVLIYYHHIVLII